MPRRRMRPILLSLCAVLVALAAGVCLVFLVFNSPSLVNRLAAVLEPVTGYGVHVDDISLSPALEGEIDNLLITQRGDSSPFLSLAHIAFKANPSRAEGILVERIVLDRPRFRFVLKADKEETDWSGLDRLPPVKLLQIKDGEIAVSGVAYRIDATRLNATVHDFSPRAGGKVRLTSAIAFNVADEGVSGSVNPMPRAAGAGSVSAEYQLASLFPRAAGKGRLTVSLETATLLGTSLKDVALVAPLSFDSERLLFDGTVLRAGSLAYEGDAMGTLKKLVFQASGSFSRRSALLSLKEVKGSLSDVGEFSGNGGARLSGNLPWRVSLTARAVHFDRVFALMGPLLPDEYRRWEIRGKGDLVLDLARNWSDDVGLGGTLKLQMRDAGFTSADKTKAGAGLTGEIVIRLRSPAAKDSHFTGQVDLEDGEFLWGAYYKDFKGERFSLSSTGQFSLGTESSFECSGDIDFYQTGRYSYRASLRDRLWSLSGVAGDVSNRRLYALLFKEYLGEDSALSGLDVSGTSEARLSLSGDHGRTMAVTGRVKVTDASLDLPKAKALFERLDLDIPFSLFPNGPVEDKEGQETGFIRLKRFQRGGIKVEGLDVPVASARNRIETLKGIEAVLFGGKVEIGAVQVTNLLTPLAGVSTRITATDLDLGQLTEELLGVIVPGMMDASLGEVSMVEGTWTSSGGVRFLVFGGDVEVRNLSGSDLLAPSRAFSADVTFRGIDLEQVTRLVKTGTVTGFIKGSIKDLNISYGEPSSFVLVLESDMSKSTRRRISVDAIENLSIIGTGSSGISSILNSGLNRFFKAYPYSRIGIMCTLKNDTFRLRGTIREGGTEYLIRRGWLRGIDVINQNPDNAISFRDMQERIGRIFSSEKPEVL
ncbi:MAG TPA: hypothetical protein DCR97_13500 [Deltaproteobacteria bacterium]|nr:hypothetical protein [Deltaproteobacteria bacterium]